MTRYEAVNFINEFFDKNKLKEAQGIILLHGDPSVSDIKDVHVSLMISGNRANLSTSLGMAMIQAPTFANIVEDSLTISKEGGA